MQLSKEERALINELKSLGGSVKFNAKYYKFRVYDSHGTPFPIASVPITQHGTVWQDCNWPRHHLMEALHKIIEDERRALIPDIWEEL